MIDTANIIDSARLNISRSEDSKLKDIEGKLSFDRMLMDEVDKASENPVKKVKDKKLMNACADMESIFIAKMLKEMRNSLPKSDWLNGGFAEEVFKDMLYDEYSKSMAKNSSFGISDMLYNQLSKKV